MKIIILGTGHGSATECYNTCFTIRENEKHFLVDAGGGNGILKQLSNMKIKVENIEAMFISHTHTDHIMGSIWIIRMIARKYLVEDYNKPFYIYGNDKVINAIRKICEVVLPEKFNELMNNKIKLNIVDTGDEIEILGKKVQFFDIKAKKVKQTGFVMWLKDQEKFTFIGDETCSKETEKYVKNSKWLFADAYMAGKEAEEYNPIKRHHHSTVKFTSELCQRLNVEKVILSHTIDTDLKHRKKNFTTDAKKYFKGTVFVPDDLEIIQL